MPFTDEFAAAPLNAGWTLIDPVGGTTVTVVNGALRWVTSTAYTDMAAWKNDAARLVQTATDDFDINVDFGRNPGNLLDGCGLYVDDGTLNNFRATYTYYDQAYTLGVPSVTTNDAGSLTSTRQQALDPSTGMGRYQRIKRTGNTLTWLLSADGTNWNTWWTGAWSGGSGQRVGILVISDRQVTWDVAYFRFANVVTNTTPPPTGTADSRIRVGGQWLQAITRSRIGGAWLPAPNGGNPALNNEVTVEQFKASAGTGGDDTAAINQAIAASSGKVLRLTKPYKHAGQINVAASGVTIDGAGGGCLVATVQSSSSVKVTGKNVVLRDLVVELESSTARFDPYAYQKLLFDGADGFKAIRVTSRKSAATGIFVTRTNGGEITDCIVEDSRADGIHITGGSSNITLNDPTATRTGDDGVAVVSYVRNSDPGKCHHITVNNPHVSAQTVRGRGVTVVGGEDIIINDVDIDGTWGPGVYIAAENYDNGNNPTYGVARVKVLGGAIKNAHSTTDISNGSILVASARAGETIADVEIRDITTTDTRATLPFEFGAYTDNGGLITNLTFANLHAISGSNGQLVYTNVVAAQFTQTNITKAAA